VHSAFNAKDLSLLPLLLAVVAVVASLPGTEAVEGDNVVLDDSDELISVTLLLLLLLLSTKRKYGSPPGPRTSSGRGPG
jgi:hypothetical protein